jgi:AcrR family transcriptional regulator
VTPKPVRPGLFFDVPAALSRGRHQLSRDEVRTAQRERLMAAFTELLADSGYGGVRVAEIANRAGVSNEAFYEVFNDKEDCAFAAYDRFIEVLVRRMQDRLTPSQTWREFCRVALEAYLGALEDDLVVARAFQLEMDALGVRAREARRAALTGMAQLFMDAEAEMAKSDSLLVPQPLSVRLGIIYATRELACTALDTTDEPNLRALIPEVLDWIVGASYPGAEEAGPDRIRRSAARG